MANITHSVRETARMLSLGSTKIYELINSNDLEVVKIGRKTLIKRDSILALVERCSIKGGQ
ncbi:helix-turn-helix domain-containing protein [Sphingopyxis yananensis]|uniref:helix-turn-helix domain-containing protein n=1 Tax=Sphingopyxis yananensis TaxID=2886687 RepID=UPI001D0FBFDB|nr:helix-turn-helix domain-containing protein [Sphingopyxis yananensis]MCC2601106.1 helix-turn-helix domain-containing protein [Sphingopyxis yananensis]